MPVQQEPRRARVVVTLGVTQTLSWASSYYLPAILAVPMSRDIGVAPNWTFGAFAAALLLAGVLGPRVGRQIDRHGGRGVLAWSNVVLATGLVMLAFAHGLAGLVAAWLVLGIGMAMGLYEAAFAALVAIYRQSSRGPISGITLIAGFASTVGWPISAALETTYGWRVTCLVWAGVNMLVCLPLNYWLLPSAVAPMPVAAVPSGDVTVAEDAGLQAWHRRAMILLGVAFALASFVSGAMATHLPNLLREMGATPSAAIAAGALVGPAQVAARLVEFSLIKYVPAVASAWAAMSLHPIGAILLYGFGAPVAGAFAFLHGAGNGLLTIARGTLPLAIFGPVGYGHRQGLIGAPARFSQALAPLLFGFAIQHSTSLAIFVSSTCMIVALLALVALGRAEPAATVTDARP
jgi:hypothetical protein